MAVSKNHAPKTTLAALQAQLGVLEKKTGQSVNAILSDGRGAYAALRQRWEGTQVSSHLQTVVSDGQARVADLLKKAETAGVEVLGHATRFQSAAMGALGLATLDQVEHLERQVKRLAKRTEQLPRST
ncbi:MAG TPA: hypothetical protein VF341_04240 [Anaeromyxobacteraceae bacterium]